MAQRVSKIGSLLNERKRLRLLISFHRRSLLTHSATEMFDLLIQEVRQLLEAERVTIFLVDTRLGEVYARSASGLDSKSLSTLRFPVTQGIAGYVARTGKSVNLLNAYKDSRFDPRFDELYGFNTRSVLAIPFKNSKAAIIGVLEAFNKAKNLKFTSEDEGLLELVAGQIATTIETSQLFEQLKRSSREAIYILAQAAEYRDQEETGLHLKRMSEYSAVIAAKLGMGGELVEMIRLASPLHDIGKIAIRDSILKKPGRYTPEEHEEMKKHTLLGYEILKDAESPMLQIARDIALTHHERYDGEGYPRKLKGKEIPLESRIVAVADVFDALSTERVYKPPWPAQRVVEHVVAEAGKHFDPEVIEAFCSAQSEIELVKKLSL